MRNRDHGLDMTPEEKEEHDKFLLRYIRDELAEAAWQIFLPSQGSQKHLDPRIEKLFDFLCYAISLHLQDFEGWEEADDLVSEYEYVFRDEVMEVISNEVEAKPEMENLRFHFNDGEEPGEEIPF